VLLNEEADSMHLFIFTQQRTASLPIVEYPFSTT